MLRVAAWKCAVCLGAIVLAGEAAAVRAQSLPEFDKLPSQPQLPPALKMFDGTPVTSREQWYQQRRPELKLLFQHYMYGYMPPPPGITSRVERVDADLFGGKATLKQIEIRFHNLPENAPRIHLALFLPNQAKGPVPVFLGLNPCGNHTVAADPRIVINEAAWGSKNCSVPKETGRGKDADFWAIENTLDRGYAFATFHESDIDPDQHDFTDGIHPFYPNLPGPKEARWGTIAAWAWGLHRAVDYLVSDPAIDTGRLCVIGHSRRGKTALLAGAFDERIALVVPHQSGTGGCALSRDNDQETVERINRVFPHWFNDEFAKFGGHEEKLPIDQHLLMALVAPRALLDTEGIQDKWANYGNGYRALQAADGVYKFLGAKGAVGTGLVEEPQTLAGPNQGSLVQYRRDTQHTLNKGYWDAILDFADGYFASRKPPE